LQINLQFNVSSLVLRTAWGVSLLPKLRLWPLIGYNWKPILLFWVTNS